MNKKQILLRLKAIAEEIIMDGADIDALEKESNELRNKLTAIEKRESILKGLTNGELEGDNIEKPEGVEERSKEIDQSEKRGKLLKESRSVSVGSSNIVVPAHTGEKINPTFNQVSTLVDRVQIKPLQGGESFKQAYEVTTADGDYTAEGANYVDADTTFGYATITKSKITAYSEETEEVIKLPNADYDSVIRGGISKSLRKKITKEILVGDGTANHLTGIFDDGATAIDASTDISFAAIDENTLDDIIFAYGGPEDVEDDAVLILNKADLKAFKKVKGADKKSAYDIKLNGNTGTINDVPFIINSACKQLTLAGTTSGSYCMAYGSLSNYMLAIFSDVDIQRSTDYKFKQGMIAHRGGVFVGGNVVAKNGFLRVKKS